jgi:hypothetical protein
VLALQRAAGNAAVTRLLRQTPAAAPAPAPAPAAASAAPDWRAIVPDATDHVFSSYNDAAKAQQLTHLAPPAPRHRSRAPAPAAPAPVGLDPAQQAAADQACAAVAGYRATLAGPAVTDGITRSQGAKWAGTSWTRYSGLGAHGALRPPKPTRKNSHPDDPRTAAQKQAYESQESYISWMSSESHAIGSMTKPADAKLTDAYREWLGNRLYFDIGSMEGGFDSVNVYDSQIVTWGAGLGGGSGYVADAMRSLAGSTLTGGGKVVGDEVTRILHSAGIDLEDVPGRPGRSRFVVLDTAGERVYRGDDALQVIKSDNRLLMLFTSLARGELPGLDSTSVPTPAGGAAPSVSLQDAARRAAFEGQRHVFLDTYNGSGFSAAVRELGSTWPYESIEMVLHLNWWGRASWTQFRDTHGDMKAIITKAIDLKESYVEHRGGANVAVRDLAEHLFGFGGASSRACWGEEQRLPADRLVAGAYYIETKPEVAAVDAAPETVVDGKVTKKGRAAVAHEDAKYRRLR